MPVLIWNRPFDRPRLMAALGIDMPIETTYDAMDCWHVCFNSLPRKLGFATACLPSSHGIGMWKNLSQTNPGYYSTVDSITTLRNWFDCQQILHATGAHGAYKLICQDLDPTLDHMTKKGLLVDPETRAALTIELTAKLAELQQQMNAVVPDEVKSPHVWKSLAGAQKGQQTYVAKLQREGDENWRLAAAAPLYGIPAEKTVDSCARCGKVSVTKPHVTRKTLKVTKETPCSSPK